MLKQEIVRRKYIVYLQSVEVHVLPHRSFCLIFVSQRPGHIYNGLFSPCKEEGNIEGFFTPTARSSCQKGLHEEPQGKREMLRRNHLFREVAVGTGLPLTLCLLAYEELGVSNSYELAG